jgi:hypothetical protein
MYSQIHPNGHEPYILPSDSPPGLSDFSKPEGAAPVFQILKGFQGRSPWLAFPDPDTKLRLEILCSPPRLAIFLWFAAFIAFAANKEKYT